MNKAQYLVGKGFPAGLAEMEINIKGRTANGLYHIGWRYDHLGEGGAKLKYARNIEAIRTLFKLQQEHRGATAEEQQVLSQYVGWG